MVPRLFGDVWTVDDHHVPHLSALLLPTIRRYRTVFHTVA
jgi:hypothetical protein